MSYKNFATAQYKSDVDIAPAGTITLPYPFGTDQSMFGSGDPEQAVVYVGSNRGQGTDFVTFTYNASDITVTNAGDVAWPAGIDLLFQMPKTPVVTGAAQDVIDKSAAVHAATAAIAALVSPADEPTTTAKINEIITALKTSA